MTDDKKNRIREMLNPFIGKDSNTTFWKKKKEYKREEKVKYERGKKSEERRTTWEFRRDETSGELL